MPLRSLAPFATALVLLVPPVLPGTACVLTPYEPPNDLGELREQQRAQADRLARALCSSYYACSCEQPYPEHETEAECIEVIMEGVYARLEQGIDRGLDYDPSCLDTHAEYLEALGCGTDDALAAQAQLRWLLEAADRCFTYHGGRTLGDDCTSLPTARGHDCEPGLACADVSICVDVTPLSAGHPCGTAEDPPCALGLACSYASGILGRICMPPGGFGEQCFEEAACVDEAFCNFEQSACMPRAQLGESCGVTLCAHELRCINGTCTEGAGPSEPCLPGGPPEGCGFGLTCGEGNTCGALRPLVCDYHERLP